jgi:S1-C subfamily serine protease
MIRKTALLLAAFFILNSSYSQTLRSININAYKYIVIDEIRGKNISETRKFLVKNLQEAGYIVINLSNPQKTHEEYPEDLKNNGDLALYLVTMVSSSACFNVEIGLLNSQNQLLFSDYGESCGLLSNAIKSSISSLTSFFYKYDASLRRPRYESAEPSTKGPNQDQNSEWKGGGTGFFISKEGYIATNFHVIENSSEIQVSFSQNEKKFSYRAKLIIQDPDSDLAILKIEDDNFKPTKDLPYSINTETADLGTDVFSLGFPLTQIMGSDIKFTDGKISSKTGINGRISDYQISVPIQPGNSGGPLFNFKGDLIGITSSGFNRELNLTENVNYAVKASYLLNLIQLLPRKLEIGDKSNQENQSTELTEIIKTYSDFVVIINYK